MQHDIVYQPPSMESSLTMTAEAHTVENLRSMFSEMDVATLTEVLRAANGDLTKAAEYLVEMVPMHEVATPSSSAAPVSDRVPPTVIVAQDSDSSFPSLVSTVVEAWDVIPKEMSATDTATPCTDSGISTESMVNTEASDETDFVVVDRDGEDDEWCMVDDKKENVSEPINIAPEPRPQTPASSNPTSYAGAIRSAPHTVSTMASATRVPSSLGSKDGVNRVDIQKHRTHTDWSDNHSMDKASEPLQRYARNMPHKMKRENQRKQKAIKRAMAV